MRYLAMIEWDPSPIGDDLDFWIWTRDRFDWIVEDLVECLDGGFSTVVGSCPGATITWVKKVVGDRKIDVTTKAQTACNQIIKTKGKRDNE